MLWSRNNIGKFILGLLLLSGLLSQIWVLIPHQTGDKTAIAVHNFLLIPSSLIAVLLCLFVAFHKPELKRTWYFIAAGLGCSFLGDLTWLILHTILQVNPFPSLADAFYLSNTLFISIGLLNIPRVPFRQLELPRLVINIGIVITSLGTLLWYFLFTQIISANQDFVALAFSLAYPFNSLVLFTFILSIVLRPQGVFFRTELIFLFFAVLSLTIADLGFSFQSAYETEQEIGFFDSLWSWSSVAFGFTAYWHLHHKSILEELKKNKFMVGALLPLSAPMIAVIVLIGLYIFSGQQQSTALKDIGLNIGVMLVVLLVVMQQVLAFAENRQLNTRLLQLSQDLEARVEQRTEQLKWNATHDALTGLANRQLLSQQLETLLLKLDLAILFIDLNGFKRINDTLGHMVGDQLLKDVAVRLTNHGQVVARTGGDEFVVICLDPDNAFKTAQHLLQQIEHPFNINGYEFTISASIGIGLSPTDGNDAETLQRHADAAMYAAKAKGGGQIEVFSAAIRQQLERRFILEQCLRGALERQEMGLVYQPILAIKTGQLESFEALIRWNSAQLGLVSPSEFIGIAEETGLMPKLTTWVIQNVCRQQVAWRTSGLSIVPISVNIPMALIGQSELSQLLEQQLQNHQLEARYLQIELLEDTLALPHIGQQLQQLRELGILIAIDDFGTGYSSLSYLHSLPVNCIKIDRSFIQQENAQILLEAMIELAKRLDLRVIVEGVETKQQLERLKTLKCDAIQGFYFAQPADSEKAIVWLKNPVF